MSCPVCHHPILDSAYVCHRCSHALAGLMTEAIGMLGDLDDSITRQVRIGGAGATSDAKEPTVPRGPYHHPVSDPCDHESCHEIITARSRWRVWAGAEEPVPHEQPIMHNPAASEARWVLEATVTTWARHISEERGVPIPTSERATIRVAAVGDDRHIPVERCWCCDLPAYSCGRRP